MDFKLSTPIEAHGETIETIILREPTVKDIKKAGLMPFSVDSTGNVNTNTSAICSYISILGDIPPSSVDKFSAQDFLNLSMAIISFFGSAPQTSGTSSEL